MTCDRATSETTVPSTGCCAPQLQAKDCCDHRKAVGSVGNDTVDHPAHYTAGRIECIDAIESAVTGMNGSEAVLVGNVIKYVWRFARKNGTEDLRKAKWYLERLIDKSLVVKASKIGPDYEVAK